MQNLINMALGNSLAVYGNHHEILLNICLQNVLIATCYSVGMFNQLNLRHQKVLYQTRYAAETVSDARHVKNTLMSAYRSIYQWVLK